MCAVSLILIPCSERKNIQNNCLKENMQFKFNSLQELRRRMIAALANTPDLAQKSENSEGIMNENAPYSLAHTLYTGRLNQAARPVTDRLPIDNFHILIVSGLYGLVHPLECIRNYELDLNNLLELPGNSIEKVSAFWIRNSLWKYLCDYIRENKITHVWSLLSQDYHDLFCHAWRYGCNNNSFKCWHVKPFGQRRNAGLFRGKWLIFKFINDRQFFTETPRNHEMIELLDSNGRKVRRKFEYRKCNIKRP